MKSTTLSMARILNVDSLGGAILRKLSLRVGSHATFSMSLRLRAAKETCGTLTRACVRVITLQRGRLLSEFKHEF